MEREQEESDGHKGDAKWCEVALQGRSGFSDGPESLFNSSALYRAQLLHKEKPLNLDTATSASTGEKEKQQGEETVYYKYQAAILRAQVDQWE